MIIIPELEKIVLCPPKTASTTLRKAIKQTHPLSFVLYTHGEANAIPLGYDSWEKVGLIRNPVDRLYSLYCYLIEFDHPTCGLHSFRMRDSVHGVTFENWILQNQSVFSYGFTKNSVPSPRYLTLHAMPETRKPQTMTLRPDLGTKVWLFEDIVAFGEMLGLKLEHKTPRAAPHIRKAAQRHINYYFESDYNLIEDLCNAI